MQDVTTPKVTWDTAVAQFENLIKFAARQQVEYSSGRDSSKDIDDYVQEGNVKLYQCWVKWCVERGKDMDEFGPIFRKALFRRMRNYARTSKGSGNTSDIDDLASYIEDKNSEDVVERLDMEEGLASLQSLLSNPIAIKIVQELYSPSEATLFEVWADIKRKEYLKAQGKKVNVPKDNTVRMKHIMRSLGITTRQYDNAMLEIREKAPLAFKS